VFKKTTAQRKILKLKKRVRVVQGGSSSSKTFSIIPILITYADDNPNKEISIVAESIPHLRRGAIRDFVKIMELVGMFDPNAWNKSTLTYKFPNGSFIEFFSADQPDKMRGARRDVLFVNEANNVDWESYHQLAIRTREFIYIDFNPVKEFWAHTELIGKPGVSFVILTYKDNEAVEPSIINEFKKAEAKAETSDYWRNWVDVYVYGRIGSLQGVVFSNWSQIDTIPSDAEYIGTGLDFGYTNDPTAAIDVYKYNGKIIADEVLYRKGMQNNEVAAALKDVKRYIVADSAEPKSIAELRQYGLVVVGADKGRDSVNAGIQLMQQYDILVTKRSLNLIKELRAYVWMTDKAGAALNKPVDYLNHGIDGFRYLCQNRLSKKNIGNYAIS
jgi:phage terminase large subunit